MEALAVRELGMRPSEFWELNYYEWSLWCGRIVHLVEERNRDRKLLIELERNSMALLANLHSTKKFTGQDFYKLPSDIKATTAGMSDKEIMELVTQRFKKHLRNGRRTR